MSSISANFSTLPVTFDASPSNAERRIGKMALSFATHITHMVMGEGGLPFEVKVEGDVLDAQGAKVGTLTGEFMNGAAFLPLPDALSPNRFKVPAGTVMPAWKGEVDYHLTWGVLKTFETAWIFPSDMSDPKSPLCVLSQSDITGGTGHFVNATGSVLTHDGFDDKGSLDINISLPRV